MEGSGNPFGKGLGCSGIPFKRSWARLGLFFGVQNPTCTKHWSKMGSKRFFEPILINFWKAWARFGERWGKLGKVLGGFGLSKLQLWCHVVALPAFQTGESSSLRFVGLDLYNVECSLDVFTSHSL